MALPDTVAAVDLGSNSFHLVLARVTEGEPVIIDRLREMVQLASGLDASRHLDRAAQRRALECLERFGQRLRHVPPEGVRAVGTNTLRSAREGEEFLARAEAALGHPIETISGIEEARLIYLGAAHSLGQTPGRRLVLDIGGGSTELIVGEGFRPLDMESLYVGCVTLSRKHFPDGEVTQDRWYRAEIAARRELAPIAGRFRELGWDQAVGTSGTIRAVGTIAEQIAPGQGITPAVLAQLGEMLIKARQMKRFKLEGLSATRRPYFPGGVVVLETALRSLGIERIHFADGALREGVMYDLLGRIREEDVRARSVLALAERYHIDWKQADRVECTAMECLVGVEDTWDLGGREGRQFLSWAAKLHEIGLDIAHHHHHRHGEYVVAHADLPGFSVQEQRLLSILVRAHRRRFPGNSFRSLPRKTARRLLRLAILLRLAVVLHRGRAPQELNGLELVAGKRSLEVRFPEGWLERNPLSRADLEQEAAYLAAEDFELTVL